MKRADYISWDEYFMGIAMLAAKRSKDPSTQVGCCIVSQENIIISTGYNGMPKGCSDDEFPWAREGGVRNQSIEPTPSLCLGVCDASVGEMVSAYTVKYYQMNQT